MATIDEGSLRFEFRDARAVAKFDGADHGLSHTMKAVDFVVTWDEEIWLVEVKDPTDPRIPLHKISDVRTDFIQKVGSGKLIEHELKPKLRDSFLYLHLEARLEPSRLRYLVLLAIDLDPRLMMAQRERLERLLPIHGPGGRPWRRPFVSDALILDIETWNSSLPGTRVHRL